MCENYFSSEMLLTELEEQLFNKSENGNLSMGLPGAAFIASGLDSIQIEEYMKRFNDFSTNIRDKIKGDDKRKDAEAIFHWLWKTKPNRYERGGNFRLHLVIDAYWGETEKVGNCLGLTTLYNSLVQEFGIPMKTAYLENFMGFPHVFSILFSDEGKIPIENIFPNGFDYDSHKHNREIAVWDNLHLVADIYNSRANEEESDELRMKRDLLLSFEGYS